jgi:uncharacterized protein (TIGR00730 family)
MDSPIVVVVGASQIQPGEPEYQDGIRLGRLLAGAGCTVATGGYGGLMEAVSAGAAQTGGRTIGITAPAVFPARSGANRHVTEERPSGTITERIHDLLAMADAIVALPGSLGTFTELMVAWNMAFVAPFSGRHPKPIVAVGSTWGELVPMLAQRLGTNDDLVSCADTVEEAFDFVMRHIGRQPTKSGGG